VGQQGKHEQHDTVVVVAGGPGETRQAIRVPAGAIVIAADGGVDRALALGLDVAVAVGDFDSATAAGLAGVTAAGARIERHSTEKDATDLELALDVALGFEPRRILVLGSESGRLDHLLSTLLLLGAARYATVEIDAELGMATAHVIRGERSLAGTPGGLVSLFALHGLASGVTTEGLRFPLHDESLQAGSSRGVSNVFVASEARVAVAHGVLLAVSPADQLNERSVR
jgi:thiamine pyrophosphokinase